MGTCSSRGRKPINMGLTVRALCCWISQSGMPGVRTPKSLDCNSGRCPGEAPQCRQLPKLRPRCLMCFSLVVQQLYRTLAGPWIQTLPGPWILARTIAGAAFIFAGVLARSLGPEVARQQRLQICFIGAAMRTEIRGFIHVGSCCYRNSG